MSQFRVEFSPKAQRDMKKLPLHSQEKILNESLALETNPFPTTKSIKRIKNLDFPCYRLRIDTKDDSFRLFYGIEGSFVYVLRIVSKKEADRIIKSLRKVKLSSD